MASRHKTPDRPEAPPAKAKVTAKSTKKKATAKIPKPPGRKPWTPDLEKIEKWASQGLKDSEIAALCGVCKQTFSERKTELNEQKEPSELTNALARGRAKGTAMASTALWQAIAGGDVNATKFFLERRAGWTAKQVIERVDLESLSTEELLALLEEQSAG